jgi:predicted dienelactone hydrolase
MGPSAWVAGLSRGGSSEGQANDDQGEPDREARVERIFDRDPSDLTPLIADLEQQDQANDLDQGAEQSQGQRVPGRHGRRPKDLRNAG